MYPYASKLPHPSAAVVFDCDGLLVNTQGAWDRAYAQLADRYGISLTSRDRHALVGLQLEPLGHALAELLGQSVPPARLGREVYALVRTNLGAGHRPMPGAVELIHAMRGTRPMAVASNTPSEIVTDYLDDAGIIDAFDVVICSDQVNDPKPAPDLYLTACRLLRRNPGECVALEDSPTGAIAALAAGLYLIGIPSSPDLVFPAHQHFGTLEEPLLWRSLAAAPNILSA